ncbi:MAG: hypothetical protein KGJ68_15280, partial [Gammaproteobacteria bacterium]|nr:hypothetical protein [Gammaproteobacteria bacterium]
TPQLRSGYYGPFIGSLLDIARLFDSFHTAKYQYIAALASPGGRELALTLNAPPSFHDPKSVLVVALPPIEAAQSPLLRPVDAKEVYCAKKSPLVLAAEGAPAMFAGAFARGLTLRLTTPSGTQLELPAKADAAQGGFAVDTSALAGATLGDSTVAALHGDWGFGKYDGPSFTLVDAEARAPTLAPGDEAALIVGREDAVHVFVGSVACVRGIALSDAEGRESSVEWKAARPDEVEAKIPLEAAQPGAVALVIRQYGSAQPERLTLHAYSEAAHLEGFTLHAGEAGGVLRGDRLDEVDALTLKDVAFAPGSLSSSGGHDELSMLEAAPPASPAPELKPGEKTRARVTLKDGRAYEVSVLVLAPRPVATLIGKSVQFPAAATTGHAIRLASEDELPQDALLTFSLHARVPAAFTRDDRIEVATADGSASAVLAQGSGMTLQNSRIAVATLDPARAFGSSAFGPLRFRVVNAAGTGDWQPLATLVRLPVLTDLQCAAAPDATCQLSGTNLFLLQSVSVDAKFARPTAIPDGFTGQTLSVPRPADGRLYVKLRDDPGVVSVAMIDAPATPARDAPADAPAGSAGEAQGGAQGGAQAGAAAGAPAQTPSNAPGPAPKAGAAAPPPTPLPAGTST